MTAANIPEGSDGTGGGGSGGAAAAAAAAAGAATGTAAATCALCAVTASAALSHGISSAAAATCTCTGGGFATNCPWNAGGAGTGTEPAGSDGASDGMGGGVTGCPCDAPEGMRGSSKPCDTARAVAPSPVVISDTLVHLTYLVLQRLLSVPLSS